VLGNVARTDARLGSMDFSIAHAYVHGVVFNRRDRPEIRTTADLHGKVIGVLEGDLAHLHALAHDGWAAPFAASMLPKRSSMR